MSLSFRATDCPMLLSHPSLLYTINFEVGRLPTLIHSSLKGIDLHESCQKPLLHWSRIPHFYENATLPPLMPLWGNCFPCAFSKVPLTIHHFSMVPYFEGVGLGLFSFLSEGIHFHRYFFKCLIHFFWGDWFLYVFTKIFYRPFLLYHSIPGGKMPGGHQSFLSGYIFSDVSSTTTLHSWIIPFIHTFHVKFSFFILPCPVLRYFPGNRFLDIMAKHSSALSFHTLKRGSFVYLPGKFLAYLHSSLRGLVSISFQRSLLPSLLCSFIPNL